MRIQAEQGVQDRTSRLPVRFALAGIIIGSFWMGLYLLDYQYDPFHLPPPPPLYTLLERMMFVLCPGLLLQVFTIGTRDRVAYVMWALAIVLNAPAYYLVGLLLEAILKRTRQGLAR